MKKYYRIGLILEVDDHITEEDIYAKFEDSTIKGFDVVEVEYAEESDYEEAVDDDGDEDETDEDETNEEREEKKRIMEELAGDE